jgi:hypothetical protein
MQNSGSSRTFNEDVLRMVSHKPVLGWLTRQQYEYGEGNALFGSQSGSSVNLRRLQRDLEGGSSSSHNSAQPRR